MFQLIINTSLINSALSMPADQMTKAILLNVGWIPIVVVLLWGAKEIWLDYINNQWGSTIKKVILAIDIPRGNEQGVEAVENLMTYFGGAHGTLNLIETYWEGRYQLSFSFEIVSIDGYTQFLIRSPEIYRNLVESAVYSQYPDAEITEVRDYTEGLPSNFPDDDWDVWGAEFIQKAPSAYPIKTYKEFYTTTGPAETQFKDPMASLMDLCSSLKKGEQLWFQMLVKPKDFSWPKEHENEVRKILKEKIPSSGGIISGFLGGFLGEIMSLVNETMRQIVSLLFDVGESSVSPQEDDSLRMMNLKPKEKKQVEAIHMKSSKLGFDCKFRFVYISRKDVMNKPKVVNGFVGYMKQFMDLDLNNLRPDMERTATSTSYFFKEGRLNAKKRRIVQGFKDRDTTLGRKTGVYNIEEMATMWHFPIEASVKAPLIQKAPGRKAEPPMTLPFGTEAVAENFQLDPGSMGEDIFTLETDDKKEDINMTEEQIKPSNDNRLASPPENLPFSD